MRIRIDGVILTKEKPQKRNYTHGIYAMLMEQLKPETAEWFHQNNREIRLLTFTNVYIHGSGREGDKVHLYVAGKEEWIQEIIEGMVRHEFIRIEDMTIAVQKITPLPPLAKKDAYLFKTKVILTYPHQRPKRLIEDLDMAERRLHKTILNRAKKVGIEGEVRARMVMPQRHVEAYKKGHIHSYKTLLEVRGDYDVIATMYEYGVGENTASGHGFLFEVM